MMNTKIVEKYIIHKRIREKEEFHSKEGDTVSLRCCKRP